MAKSQVTRHVSQGDIPLAKWPEHMINRSTVTGPSTAISYQWSKLQYIHEDGEWMENVYLFKVKSPVYLYN